MKTQDQYRRGRAGGRQALWPKSAGCVLSLAVLAAASAAGAETNSNAASEGPAALPPAIVVAEKQEAEAARLPVSVTAVDRSTIEAGDILSVSQAASYAPDTFLNQFSARALSNPFFRGIGGSPANPGVTTFIDGVPQLNSYSSSIELLDLDHVEFVRGPQGALFGRNTAGGVINLVSRPPSDTWTGEAAANYGNYDFWDARGAASGPLVKNQLGFSLAGGYSSRDGYTKNDVSGTDVDSRSGGFGKGQLAYHPTDELEIRLIGSGESDHDGDYALGDLDYIRAHPHHVRRDFNDGHNDRDVTAGTLLATYTGAQAQISSISGVVWWKNDGLTDLDYGQATLQNGGLYATRHNREQQWQATQELRAGNPTDRPIGLSKNFDLAWQSGLFLFTEDYQQNAANSISSIYGFFPPSGGLSTADLDSSGLGLYGQARLTAWERLEFSAGLRWDYEDKEATLGGLGAANSTPSSHFAEVSPQFALDYRFTTNQMVYASAARGFKAGGFNPPPTGVPAPAGTAEYGAEHTWNYELGVKARWLEGKLETTAALFYIDWENLQLNQQLPLSGGQYYIANAGRAASKGVELEVKYRPLKWWDLFGSVGYADAWFLNGSRAYNANLGFNQDVSGKRLPYAPAATGNAGTQVSWSPAQALTLYLRAQVTVAGDFEYDASNARGQSAYALANFRAGVRGRHWFAEGWVNNAFDSHYVPVAIPYAMLGAPSGYVGESGAPVTFGLRAGAFF